ncbi:MAG: hypothetical protein ACD_80C00205G0004 [uncultured bacterium (gcode 4)]|uniref:Uncharacterized protein n=1 Tax=uncultured bacterium (gcode 4) TaxID=1234023 RepID=K1XH19_9BACT|nr:MAG: hypothetical protein ACD_80C00205G0004 [uncultured bacterium (gcode 4)]
MDQLNEKSDTHQQYEWAKDKIVQWIKDVLQRHLKDPTNSLREQEDMINLCLDNIPDMENIDVAALDDKDKTFLILLERFSDLDKIILSPDIKNEKILMEYHKKWTDLELDRSETVFDLLLWKETNLLDNKLGLDKDDFVHMGCLILDQYKNTDELHDIDRDTQLTDFVQKWSAVSPLLLILMKVRKNNNIQEDVFAKRLIKNFDYFYELCNSNTPSCVVYISMILWRLWCTQEQLSYVQKKYYWLPVE